VSPEEQKHKGVTGVPGETKEDDEKGKGWASDE
jgi:hypothetical protein